VHGKGGEWIFCRMSGTRLTCNCVAAADSTLLPVATAAFAAAAVVAGTPKPVPVAQNPLDDHGYELLRQKCPPPPQASDVAIAVVFHSRLDSLIATANALSEIPA
jgi:hypothetical protein